MYFGEFLLDRKIINEDQLLDALIFQVEHLPSFLRVLRDDKKISSHDIIRIIQLQIENNSDLVSVLKSENKIDEKKLGDLYKKQTEDRKMLGAVLVELNFVNQSVIEKMLHEFLRDSDKMNMIQRKQQEVPVEKQETVIEISDAALESLRALGFSDDGLVAGTPVATTPVAKTVVESAATKVVPDSTPNFFIDEFLNVFSVKMNKKLSKLLVILNQSAKEESDISNYFNSLYRDLVILKSSASLGDLSLSLEMLNELGSIIEEKIELDREQLTNWSLQALPVIGESIVCLWEMRDFIFRNRIEKNIKNMTDLHQKYMNVMENLTLIR